MQITLPTSYAITSRDTFVNVDPSRLSPEIVAKLVLHGLTQKVADAAAGAMADAGFKGLKFDDLAEADKAKVRDHAKTAMQAVVDALVKGEWSERRAAVAVDPLVAKTRTVFGEYLRANAPDVWKAMFKGLDAADRGPALDAFLAEQDNDVQTAMREAAAEELAAEARTKAKTAKLAIKINL